MQRPSGSAVLAGVFAVALLNTAPAAAALVVDTATRAVRGAHIDLAAVDASTVTINRPREGVSATHARLGAAARA